MLTLNSSVVDTLVASRAFSRAIWIDAESNESGAFDIVLRGWDKTQVGAKPSASPDASNRKEHKPALAWNDESAACRRFVLATVDDKASAETCAVQLTEFYASADDSVATFTLRHDALGTDAKTVLPILLALFGAAPNSEQLAGATRIGSYADHLLGKVRTPKIAKLGKRAQREAELVAQAKRDALAELAATLSNREALSALTSNPAAPSNLESQLAELQSKLAALLATA